MSGNPEPANTAQPAHAGFEQMQQLTIYISETDHYERRPLYLRILELAREHDAAGATVLRGLAGYSASSHAIRTAGFADLLQKLPLVVVIVDNAQKIEGLLPHLETMVQVNGGLITVQDLEGHCYLHPSIPRGQGRK